MPKGKKNRRVQGVFTYTLFEALARNPGITYRQLGQDILQQYSIRNLARATPLFEGDLDTVVFRGTRAQPVRQWRLNTDNMTVPAGALQGLDAGVQMALVASAADEDTAALGYFTVTDSDALSAVVIPVAANGRAAPDPANLPRGALLRKLSSDVDFGLTIARPDPTAAPDLAARLDAAIAEIAEADLLGPRTRFVAPGAPADLRLAILPDSARPQAVWLLPATGLLEQGGARTSSVGIADKSVDELAEILADTLTRLGRVQNLLRIGAAYGASDLAVEVELLTRTATDRRLRPLDPVSVPRLIPGDEIHIRARNNSDAPVDINVLFVGSDYSISHFYSGRMQPGNELKKGLLRITDTAFGRDRLILVLSPANPGSLTLDLGFMAQDTLTLTRGGGASALASAFADAGFGSVSRAAVALDDGADGPTGAVLQFELDTIPAGG